MTPFLQAALAALGFDLILVMLLHLTPRLRLSNLVTRAPGLDVVVAALTWLPWIAASCWLGWRGLIGSILGQFAALWVWVILHEAANSEAARGPRIVKSLNRTVGRWRNHAGLIVTMIAYPLFWGVRLGEVVVYPMLIALIGLPKYKQSEWVNVSRQKFSGLVGHDLIWCLYCDWMTGVYSLGAEMLRNVESFWCPIRFYDGKKCENCKIDFPDLDHGWAPADATIADAAKIIDEKYADGRREWFGHPARLTIEGKERERGSEEAKER